MKTKNIEDLSLRELKELMAGVRKEDIAKLEGADLVRMINASNRLAMLEGRDQRVVVNKVGG